MAPTGFRESATSNAPTDHVRHMMNTASSSENSTSGGPSETSMYVSRNVSCVTICSDVSGTTCLGRGWYSPSSRP